MTAGSGSGAVAGGPARHIPVLARPAIDWLAVRPGGLYVDATFGGGGMRGRFANRECPRHRYRPRSGRHCARRILVAAAGGRLELVVDRFSNLETIVGGANRVDEITSDVGVSTQLDEASRGFSFRFDGPLDMRMSGTGPSAADVIARAGEREAAAIIAGLGRKACPRNRASNHPSAPKSGYRLDPCACRDRQRGDSGARSRDPSGDANLPGAAHLRQR